MQIFVDESVPLTKRQLVRETVAAELLPTIKGHPQFADLAVLVSCDPRRGGWQLSLVVLDPELKWNGSVMPLDSAVLRSLRERLAGL